jgi:hypothetical protein
MAIGAVWCFALYQELLVMVIFVAIDALIVSERFGISGFVALCTEYCPVFPFEWIICA